MGFYLKNIFNFQNKSRKAVSLFSGSDSSPLHSDESIRRKRHNSNHTLSSTSVALSLEKESLPLYSKYVPRAIVDNWFASPNRVFRGSEQGQIAGRMMDMWRVEMKFFSANFQNGTVLCSLKRTHIRNNGPEMESVCVGEIIDNRNNFFRTDKWNIRWEDDSYFWNKFPPFDRLHRSLQTGGGRNLCLADRRYLFIRIKIISSSDSDPAKDALADRDLYYACMDRENGHLIATHYEPSRLVKILDIRPDRSEEVPRRRFVPCPTIPARALSLASSLRPTQPSRGGPSSRAGLFSRTAHSSRAPHSLHKSRSGHTMWTARASTRRSGLSRSWTVEEAICKQAGLPIVRRPGQSAESKADEIVPATATPLHK